MSILKKNVLAVALVAGLGLAGAAGAYTYWTGGDTTPEKVASADVADNTTVVTMTQDVQVRVDGTDLIVGRTTGFNVRILLNNSLFAADPAPTAGPDLPAGWTVTFSAGGAGSNYAVFNVQPPSTPTVPGIVPGEIFHVSGTQLTDVEELSTNGGTIDADFFFADPVGGTQLPNSRKNLILLQSGSPSTATCAANDGDVNTTIDVGTDGVHQPKTYFSSDGSIGNDDTGDINLGSITVDKDPSFGAFMYQATDQFTTVVTGDFSAFSAAGNSVFLSDLADCSNPVVPGTINNANGTVTFNYTGADFVPTAAPGGQASTFFVCAEAAPSNTTVIDASAVSVRTTFTRGANTSTSASCDLLDLRYNGSVVDVYVINPDGNTTAQSFVRVINPSAGAGKVTLVGTDDQGNVSGPVSLTLGAGQSIQLNSSDLENGNAAKGLTGSWGDGSGKWRAVVTGEFAGMRVQSLNRNYNDGTVTNLTDADGKGEQSFQKLFDN